MARAITRYLKKHGTYVLATVIPAIVAILTIISLLSQLANKDERIAALEDTIQSMQEAECAKHGALQSYVNDLNQQIANIGKALRNLFREKRISEQNYATLENALKEVSANSQKMSAFLDNCEVADKKLTISDSSASWIRIARSREDEGIVDKTIVLKSKFAGFNKAIDEIKHKPQGSEEDFKKITDGVEGCLETLRNINSTIINYKESNGPRGHLNASHFFVAAKSPSFLSEVTYQKQTLAYLSEDYGRSDFNHQSRLESQIVREKASASDYRITSSTANSTRPTSRKIQFRAGDEKKEKALDERPHLPLLSKSPLQLLSTSTKLSQEAIRDSILKIQNRLTSLDEEKKTYEDVRRQGKENIVSLGMQAFNEMVRIEKEAKQGKKD